MATYLDRNSPMAMSVDPPPNGGHGSGSVLWTGKLATGARVAEDFDAEITMDADGLHIWRLLDGGREPVSAHEIRGDAWLRVVVELARSADSLRW